VFLRWLLATLTDASRLRYQTSTCIQIYITTSSPTWYMVHVASTIHLPPAWRMVSVIKAIRKTFSHILFLLKGLSLKWDVALHLKEVYFGKDSGSWGIYYHHGHHRHRQQLECPLSTFSTVSVPVPSQRRDLHQRFFSKVLLKYTFKGPDRAVHNLESANAHVDEISNYENRRYFKHITFIKLYKIMWCNDFKIKIIL